MGTHLGIDLGTTTTLVARAIEGPKGAVDIRVLNINQPDGRGGTVDLSYLPSVAYFPAQGAPVVGVAAERLGAQDPERYVRAVKRQMGRRILLPVVGRRPAEVSTLYLQHALREARRTVPDQDITLTVTVPASFTTNQRSDTLQALRDACQAEHLPISPEDEGEMLISEPVAAMLAFVYQQFAKPEEARDLDLTHENRVLVYDIGGGTLDLTLVFIEPIQVPARNVADLRFVVEAISPYNPFGGEDFDLALAHWMHTRLLQQNVALRQLTLNNAQQRFGVRLQLMQIAKQAKEDLSREIEAAPPPDSLLGTDHEPTIYYTGQLRVGGQTDSYSIEGELTASTYHTIIADLLDGSQGRSLTAPVKELLERKSRKPSDLAGMLVVGGMARLPIVPQTLREYWQSGRVWVYNPADQAVATGAALYSYLRRRHPAFNLTEPAADAYYVRLEKGFDKLLGPDPWAKGGKHRYELQQSGDQLALQIFAGEDSDAQSFESIYHTLIYQGGMVVSLSKTYPAKTSVWIEMQYESDSGKDHSKVPWMRIWIGNEAGEPVLSRRYIDIVDREDDDHAPRL